MYMIKQKLPPDHWGESYKLRGSTQIGLPERQIISADL
jgi:hypothetical protein